ncbi:hypothetical protein THAOC_29514, partial [Thalassiosira oceanica]
MGHPSAVVYPLLEAVGPIQVDWGVCGLRYHHFALRARGVTPCDTSHDVAPTPDFSGSDDETKAQAPARGPYLTIRWTDGAEGGRDRVCPGRRTKRKDKAALSFGAGGDAHPHPHLRASGPSGPSASGSSSPSSTPTTSPDRTAKHARS